MSFFPQLGLDESGRGPLAGPIFVAAVFLSQNFQPPSSFKFTDSKQLSFLQREKWFHWIQVNQISYAVSFAKPQTIDKLNVSRTANLAASRALCKLSPPSNTFFIADWGLFPSSPFLFSTKKKADENYPAVSLASIIAKVLRDRYMRGLSKKYPHYKFERHQGYATPAHLDSLYKFGPSPHHRLTFLKKHNLPAPKNR